MSSRLERISLGDETAVREVIDEYGGLIWRLANRYLDHARHEIDDAVQEVFVELWLSAKRFDPSKGSEAAFVATLAHRRLIDVQRRTVTMSRTIERATREGVYPKVPVISIRSAVHRQLAIEVAERFDELPEQERQALWLAVHHGLTHRQISEATQSPIGTVKTRLRNGLLRLTRQIRSAEKEMINNQEGGVA